MSSTYSRRESLRDALVLEFANISVANGYRTDVQLVSRSLLYPQDVKNHPTIIVLLEDEAIDQMNTNRTVFNSLVKVVILGYFSGDMEYNGGERTPGEMDGEPLLHDMKRCTAGIISKYLNDATSKWHVTLKSYRVFGPVTYRDKRQGECRVELICQIDYQDIDF